jgi:peptidoglycan hydrolase CwlO-like protein
VISDLIDDLEKQLEAAQRDIDWYHRKLKECDTKVINLKETIAELKAMSKVMA